MTERYLYRVLGSYVALRVYLDLRGKGWTTQRALGAARYVAS